MQGSMIQFAANDHTTPGYLALPETGSGPGVIVIQEWWGLVDHIRSVTDRFAGAGFVALAPDLYHGQTTTSPDDAQKKLMALDIARAAQDIHGAAHHLLSLDSVRPRKVGVVGFCMGGQLALYAATEFPDAIAACVDFYGIHPNAQIDPGKLQVPLLMHFGERDSLVTNGSAQALIQRIGSAGKFVDSYFYPAGHAFFNDSRPDAFDPASAALAWDRTLAFLRDSLR